MNDAPDDDYHIILTTTIPAVREVRYYRETMEHIVENHPEFRGELPAVMAAIAETVSNPTVVYRSASAPSTSYVYESSRNKFWDQSMFVPVKVIEGASALLKTAYFSETISGTIVWRESDGS